MLLAQLQNYLNLKKNKIPNSIQMIFHHLKYNYPNKTKKKKNKFNSKNNKK